MRRAVPVAVGHAADDLSYFTHGVNHYIVAFFIEIMLIYDFNLLL